ncbi:MULTISPECIES: enoyl-CoA hydratase/isomerase family protein [Sphingopyxis]|jgi:enoyl-CoA hydratase/carnithine racemase|uniref:6-oxocamphor hydrolase n=1 Tax=Sphingopyxis granuli TaxID=267128 RepID=A0AA86GM78_9SPHN|nr:MULTISPECIES: enoyl-CoA hydratase/isomerase family protein [Sphingopyxis]AMG75614.1 6-oxocamphor hydrolase [Sphingopyxis granuli]HEV7312527.1 enoyl-CoA hydratase/isomerase family protein [Sphingopyxis sp.]
MSRLSPRFDSYRERYNNIALSRDAAGVLLMRFHTGGGPFVWSEESHEELGHCFAEVGADRGNRVIVMTGTDGVWCETIDFASFSLSNPSEWDHTFYDGRKLLDNLLAIEVPVISAINGPARIHPEIPVLADIVIASETALFQDAPHFMGGIVPGDGAHVVWTHVLGPNRGRYFLLMGQELSAADALAAGVVGELLPEGEVVDRALAIAAQFAAKTDLALRYSRVLLTQRYKRLMQEGLSLGLGLEALAAIDLLAGMDKS